MDHKRELELIKELMDKLIDEMEPSSSDFEERLGRGKPEVKSIQIEGVIPEEDIDLEDDMDDDTEEDIDTVDSIIPEDESPEEALKRRIEKLRG